jgi:hypothetical protein
MKKMMLAVLLASAVGAAACDRSPTDSGNVKPQYDGRTRVKTQTTQTTAPGDSTSTPGLGEPCDPDTYNGPNHCVADPNSVTGYIVVT